MSNADRGYCLDLRGGTNANGTNIHIYHNLENSAQRWYFHKKGINLVIRPKNSTTRVADVHYNQNDPEQYATNVHLYHYTGDDNQLWVLEPAVPDSFNELIDQGLISMSDIQCTDDDFFICTKSIADILNSKGNYTFKYVKPEGTVFINVNKFYDDWYIYAVPDDNNSFVYGLCKMREQEYDTGDADNNDPGVTISFVEFNMSVLFDYLETNNNTFRDLFDEYMDFNIRSSDALHNEHIRIYFVNPASSGAYLVAEEYVKKIASTAVYNRISLPNKFNEDDTRLYNALISINSRAGRTVYDTTTKKIVLSSKTNPDYYDKIAILTTHTTNVTFNSFAAEVVFHAYALTSWHNWIDWIPSVNWYERALRSDMGIGEEHRSGFYDKYYDLESDLVEDQVTYHGEY